jgi:hypothetical protein
MGVYQTNQELQTKLDKALMELADAHVRIKELELPLPRKVFVVWAGDPTDKKDEPTIEFLAGIYSQQRRAAAVRHMINDSEEPFLAYVEEVEIDQAPVLPAEPAAGDVDWFGDNKEKPNGKDSTASAK